MLDAILLTLLLLPHAAIGLAWWFWFRLPKGSPLPRWRSVLLLLSFASGSLNIVLFWGWILWLHQNYTPEAWKVKESCDAISNFLVLLTIVAGLFGEGRARLAICLAGLLGFFLWVTTAVGVL